MPSATERIQELTQAAATGKPKVALDTCCVQYYISNPPSQPWADCLDPIFGAAVAGKIDLYVSTVVVSELLAHVYFANRHNTGYDPELDLLAIINRHFQILDVNGAVARAAGRLRGSYAPGDKMSLKTPDALIGATSLANGHTLFVTNDAQLAGALPDTNCIYLRDIALDWLGRMFPVPCFDGNGPIAPTHRGKGLPTGASGAWMASGGIKPDPAAGWRRILKDAQTVATAVNEPCAFFVLSEKSGRKTATREVIFWHDSLAESRPAQRIVKRLHEHLGYSARTGIAGKAGSQIHGMVFASLAREQLRQSDPQFGSKTEHQKGADAWNAYLSLWRTFRGCLDLPQVSWLLCEEGTAHLLERPTTASFLDQASNVLGGNAR
ncbi:MAG: PIN domain-containing protein [Terriglobia bacterium]|jgi:predicted nucleic acid-binding protein